MDAFDVVDEAFEDTDEGRDGCCCCGGGVDGDDDVGLLLMSG